MDTARLAALGQFYRDTLLNDVVPFWLRHGMDPEHGGIITSLDRDGSILDTDKSVWFQGRAGWMLATLCNTAGPSAPWLDAARSCIEFLRNRCFGPNGKMYFTVTRQGRPLRMRRYVFSESFAAIANAAYAVAARDERAREDAIRCFETYLHHSFSPGVMPPRTDPGTRPMKGIGPLMIGMVTAQEIRQHLGDVTVQGRSMSGWIDGFIAEIRRDFMKPELEVVLETVGREGQIIDHFDGRTLNPGHAIEAAWFIMEEGRLRNDPGLVETGTTILDWMWARGWDPEYGGFLYFRDLYNKPVPEYWHDMKFWWPHNEAVIATLMAWTLTRDPRYARWHQMVHDWSFAHFSDSEFGEWYGYLHRDGTPSVRLKGNMWKGPFHLPRMLLRCWQLCDPEARPPVPSLPPRKDRA